MFHNSTESTGSDLKTYREKAQSQEDQIMEWFRTYGRPATPSSACKWIFHNSVPITSVRRALTNLTYDRKLIKTAAQTKGPYGRPEFIWELADKQGRLF